MSWTDDDVAPAGSAWTDDDIAPAPAAPRKPFIEALGDEAAATGRGYARQGKLLVRALASAAASPVNLIGDATNKFVNGAGQLLGYDPQLPSVTDWHQQQMTQAGLPRPEGAIEKVTQGLAESAPAFALPGGITAKAVPLQMLGNAALGATQAEPGKELRDAAVGFAMGGLPNAVARARDVGRGVFTHTLGTTTGAGAESVRQALKGGDDFVQNMRGHVEPGAVVEQAKQGLQNMRQQMYDSYKHSKGGWAADTTPLSFQPVGKAFDDAVKKYSFRDTMVPGATEVRDKVEAELIGWLEKARVDPAHLTVEGLDALKRHLSDIVPSDITNRTGRGFVSEVVDGVKKTIIAQRPEYAAAMKDYWQRSTQLDEISKSLSLTDRATVDTALRKLQSLMRNNVNSNFGQRVKSAEALAAQGGEDILPAVAGQAMNSWTPRGLQAAVASNAGIGSLLLNPVGLATLPAFSPRAVGEVANALGKVTRVMTPEARFAEMLRRAAPSAGRAAFTPRSEE